MAANWNIIYSGQDLSFCVIFIHIIDDLMFPKKGRVRTFSCSLPSPLPLTCPPCLEFLNPTCNVFQWSKSTSPMAYIVWVSISISKSHTRTPSTNNAMLDNQGAIKFSTISRCRLDILRITGKASQGHSGNHLFRVSNRNVKRLGQSRYQTQFSNDCLYY